MKIKILSIFFIIMLLMPTTGAVENPTVVITDYQVYPGVLMPGDVGTIKITIKNTAMVATQTDTTTDTSIGTATTTTSTKDINADIQSVYLSGKGIEVISGNYGHLGELGPGQSTTITFAVKAPHNDGTYFPEVLIDVLGGGSVKYPIPIKVDSSSVDILASNLPSEIPQGDLTEIELSIANRRPNLINGAIITPTAEGVAFTPTKIFLGTMQPDETATVKFTLNPDSIGRKDISLNLTYKNGDNLHSTSIMSSVDVKENPGVELILVNSPTSVLIGEDAEISFDVANRMSKSVSSVRVVPMVDENISPSEFFIGEIKSEEKVTAKFNLDTTDLPVGQNDIYFKISYRFADRYQESSAKASIAVIDEPGVILILTDAPTSVPRGEDAEISFDVANSRLRDVTGVRVIPVTDLIISPSEVFIGTMETDDVFSARFEIDTSDLPVGRKDLSFKVVFKDGDRSYESNDYTVSIRVVEMQSSSSASYQIVILFVVISLVIGGYYLYRRRRSKV
ncbi:MAG: hypothetical protein GKB99_01860 [Methanocellales archaeon]|nr:hypothetical protein [Methanocellales archaeon]